MTTPRIPTLSAPHIIVGCLVLVLAGSCTRRNPNVCCTTQADCDATGLPGPTPCTQDGLVCIRNVCDLPGNCQATSDCTAPFVCDVPAAVCVQCVDSSTCGNQVCDETTRSCRSCTTDDECGDSFCAPLSRTCQRGIVPSFIPHACDDRMSGAHLAIDVDTILNLDDASNCTGGTLTQTVPPICVLHYETITVMAGTTLTIRGLSAAALVADTDLTIAGTLDLDANVASNGPGGGTVVSGGAPQHLIGGGGAGFATNAGPGGAADGPGEALNGGTSSQASSISLAGGRRAAGGGGGGGGGAATLVACRGVASVTGVLSAAGGGGDRGDIQQGGFGGGSGGYIAVQGRSVSITGQAFANGGEGGLGGLMTSLGQPGVNGSRSITCVETNLVGATNVRSGNGGCITTEPGAGDAGGLMGSDTRDPGAGGGSMGFLVAFTPPGVDAVIMPSAASPAIGHATLQPQ